MSVKALLKNKWVLMLLPCLLILDLGYGLWFAVPAQTPDHLFNAFRLPRVLSAVFAGMALSVAGLVMQTLFRNPLAGPFLLGITPGASLSVALVSIGIPALTGSGVGAITGNVAAAFIGAFAVLLIQLYTAKKTRGMFTLLLVGVMLGYLFSACTEILQIIATAEQIKSFVLWGMGSFDRVLPEQLPYMGIITLISITGLWLMRHSLNAYLPGDLYASSSGLSIKKFKIALMLICGMLSATITAFCGPIGFVGLAAPHLARITMHTDNHKSLLLATPAWGAAFTLLADFIAHAPWFSLQFPVNAICSIIGAPIVLYVLWNSRNKYND